MIFDRFDRNRDGFIDWAVEAQDSGVRENKSITQDVFDFFDAD